MLRGGRTSVSDHDGTQLKQKEEQTEEDKEEQREDPQESEKILESIEEYSDQIIIEDEKIDEIPFNNQEQTQEPSYEQEEQVTENKIGIEEKIERESEQKIEGEEKEETEQRTIVEIQSLLQEEYEDQVIIKETDTGDISLTLQEEIASNSLEERLEQKIGKSNEKEYEDQIIVEKIDATDHQRSDNEFQEINKYIEEINIQIQTGNELDSKTYSYLNTLNANGSYPNIVFVYKRDGSESVEILDRGLYDKLIDNQGLGSFRLEWQRYWFEGIKAIKPTEQGRKTFLVDLSEEKDLPVSMRRIFLVRNSYTWNSLAPTKRELHSKNLREFTETVFGKRTKYSDFDNVKDFTYQKKMDLVWKEFQRIYAKDIKLKTTRRPAIFALKGEYTRENIEHALIGTFWKYHNSLDRIGRRNMKDWGYNNLLQYMEKKATGVYPTIVDPNYIGQNFVIRVVNKGRGFARFLDMIDEIKGTNPKYRVNEIYRAWIVNNEILQSKYIDGSWGVNKARTTRYIDFKDIPHLMSENNPYGINALLEALFEDTNAIMALNKYLGPKFIENCSCSYTGNARVNTGAKNISYSDLTIHSDNKPINIQIKDLGKCSDQDKKALVIYDQFKSFFSSSDNFENITVHVINGLDLVNVYDMKDHPNLTQNNLGIINIGFWENTEGINKFGEIFSALRIAHDAGFTDKEAFDKVLELLDRTGQSFTKTDEKTLRQLQEMWSDDPAKLMFSILENFGSYFRDNSTDMEGLNPKIKTNLSYDDEAERIIPDPLPLKDQTRALPASLEFLHSKLKERPLFQTFWNECTGVINVVDRRYKNGPRGFIVDMTSDTFLPEEFRTVYLVKNSNRWNIHGYDDKFLLERQFDDFINLCFRKTAVGRDFEDNSELPNYVWEHIRLNALRNINLQPNLFRPTIYTLNDRFMNNNKKSVEKTINSPENAFSSEILIASINKQLKAGSNCDKEQFEKLVEINSDYMMPNLAFVKTTKGYHSLELLEPHLYDRLKRNLTNSDFRLDFQRFWFECTDQIEVLTPKSKETPLGLILDLESDSFLPNEHKKVYIVKNSKSWNAFGYKHHLLNEGSFDTFITTLFHKMRIQDFGHREYPRYIWEQIQKEWEIKGRKGYELKIQKYRPNIYALKDIYSRETVEYTMIGVYTEYSKTLTGAVRRSFRKSGFRNLAHYFDHNRKVPKVLRPLKLPFQDFEKLFRKE
jgi:hypothetical protein